MFEPFTPEEFKKQTGMSAHENEAVYIRWVNTQINYSTYKSMLEMNNSLKEILERLKDPGMINDGKYPFSR
jgi:hypothetical protein